MSNHPKVGTENSKHRHRLPTMRNHLKCRHRKLKMLVSTTQNVGTDHPKCPTTQMSAPKTQNVSTHYSKCPPTHNVGTKNSQCRHQQLKTLALTTQNV